MYIKQKLLKKKKDKKTEVKLKWKWKNSKIFKI